MSWKPLIIVVVVALLGAWGCSGARTILRGQSPDKEPPKPVRASAPVREVAWWEDPRLTRVKPRWNDAEPSARRTKVAAAVLFLPAAVAALFLGDPSDPNDSLFTTSGGSSSHHHKSAASGGVAKPEKPSEKEAGEHRP
jgi:hypothetical protein